MATSAGRVITRSSGTATGMISRPFSVEFRTLQNQTTNINTIVVIAMAAVITIHELGCELVLVWGILYIVTAFYTFANRKLTFTYL
jgi:hypothetical protein